MLSLTHAVRPVKPAGDPAPFRDGGTPGFLAADARTRELLAAWIEGLSANTRRAYAADLSCYADFIGALDAPTAAAWLFSRDAGTGNHSVLKFKAHLTARGLSPSAVSRRLAALRSLGTAARLTGLCSWSIEVKGPSAGPIRDTMGPGDVGYAKMRQSVDADTTLQGFRDRAIVRLLHDMGLRRGEVTGLDLEHVEMDGGLPVALRVHGKGRADRERLTVPESTGRVLAAWIDRRGTRPGALFHRTDNGATADPGRLSGESVRLAVAGISRDAGLERICKPHGLRHLAVSQALDRTNGDIRSVAKFSRHKNVRTVLVYDDCRRDEAGRIAALVAGD